MEDQNQNAVQARQAELEEKLRLKRQSLIKTRSRATQSGDEEKKWRATFDIERLSKNGGLIDVCEIAPFIDCTRPEEHLNTARIFAFAFRHDGVDCKDIELNESIDRFCFRVHKLWYSNPKGSVLLFVGLRTLRFDDDMGMRQIDFDDSDWEILPGTDVTVDVAALKPIGQEPQVPEWEKAGFPDYSDWKEHLEKEKRKRKGREELERSLRTQEELNRGLKSQSSETKTPQLYYKATLPEN
jgi:hypothetical protein